MAKNRKAAEAIAIQIVDDILPGGGNGDMYRELFKTLSDEQFDTWIEMLRERKTYLRLVTPLLSEHQLDFSHLLETAKKYGVELYQRCWLTDSKTGETTLTPKKYLVVHLMIRRQQQLLIKKTSIAEDNSHIDEMTGQPTGESKGASLTFPELQIIYAKGLIFTALELAKIRGGDLKAFNRMNRQIHATGHADMDAILASKTYVQSTVTLGNILRYGMHFENNLKE